MVNPDDFTFLGMILQQAVVAGDVTSCEKLYMWSLASGVVTQIKSQEPLKPAIDNRAKERTRQQCLQQVQTAKIFVTLTCHVRTLLVTTQNCLTD